MRLLPFILIAFVACASWKVPYDQHPYYLSHPRCTAKPAQDDSANAACIADPRVAEYLEAVKGEIDDAWMVNPATRPSQQVRATLQVGPTGAVRCLSIDTNSTGAFASSVVSAIERADPFPALTTDLACVAGLPIVGTFVGLH